MKLSIIIPVYNVEKYIRPCVESLLTQRLTESDYEVILVNDGSQDRSLEQIEDILHSHQNFIVLDQKNQGLSAARNLGLSTAKGEYILFLDSDDLLIPNTLLTLLQHAMASQADLIVADFVKVSNETINNLTADEANHLDGELEEKSGIEFFLHDFNPKQCYVWRSLYKKSFLDDNQLRFIPGLYFEDVPFTTRCYLMASKCLKVPLVFYIYRQRKDSIVATINIEKLKHFNKILALLWDMKNEEHQDLAIRKKLGDNIFGTFSVAMWYISHDKKLLSQRREFVEDLKQKVPALQFTNGMKQRAISWFFNHMPCTYIKLRSLPTHKTANAIVP